MPAEVARFGRNDRRHPFLHDIQLGPQETFFNVIVTLISPGRFGLRPSGNADELRIYAVADTQDRADAIASMGVAEPDGILRRMERAVAS